VPDPRESARNAAESRPFSNEQRREAVDLARDWQTGWVPLDNAKAVADALACAVLRLNATVEEDRDAAD
jgi:hypothetical protein